MREFFFSARGCLVLLGLGWLARVEVAGATNWQVFQHEHVLGTSLGLKFAAATPAQADAARGRRAC